MLPSSSFKSFTSLESSAEVNSDIINVIVQFASNMMEKAEDAVGKCEKILFSSLRC